MRSLLFMCVLVLTLAFPVSVRGQYYSMNIDHATVAAMSAAYNAEAGTEIYYNEQIQKILDSYSAAEVASAGIFASKFLDRKGLTSLGIWSSSTENYYYRRTYNMVASKIMPKIWVVAGQMLKEPSTALYWGSYLVKICGDVKSLCYQFESIVTNSTLSFKDIAFLEIKEELVPYLKLSELGNVDWEDVFDNFVNEASSTFSKENLEADINTLYNMGANLASAGFSDGVSSLMQSSQFNDLFQGKLGKAIEIADNYSDMFDAFDKGVGNGILELVGGKDNISGLFNMSDYNLSSWVSDYAKESIGQYYTQRWYIYDDKGNTVYEDTFDSYSMNLESFKTTINTRLREYNKNEDGRKYSIGTDDKKYYQATDARKMEGVETATFSVTCNSGADLGSGTTQYKCSDCGGNVNNHTKECSMRTSVTESPVDTSELDVMATNAQNQINVIQSQIDALEDENAQIAFQISFSSVDDAVELRKKYNSNTAKIKELNASLSEWNKKLDEINQAREDATNGESVATDDYYRIPAIMNDCRSNYRLTWKDQGKWNGNTFVRMATIPNIKGDVTFKATVSISRKPKYFLGIKIHRAIVQIKWELGVDYSDSEVVEVMNLDPSMSNDEKANLVNKKISDISRDFPDCTVSVEYAKSVPTETDDTEDVQHLLWSSDRLEIARQIDSRLTKIYADLVSLEKMMHYKHSIIDWLKDIAPNINDESGRRLTLLQQCHRRWMKHAGSKNANYEEPNE